MRRNNYQRVIQHVTLNQEDSVTKTVKRLSHLSINAIQAITPQDLLSTTSGSRNRILLFDYEESLDLFQQVLNLPLASKKF